MALDASAKTFKKTFKKIRPGLCISIDYSSVYTQIFTTAKGELKNGRDFLDNVANAIVDDKSVDEVGGAPNGDRLVGAKLISIKDGSTETQVVEVKIGDNNHTYKVKKPAPTKKMLQFFPSRAN